MHPLTLSFTVVMFVNYVSVVSTSPVPETFLLDSTVIEEVKEPDSRKQVLREFDGRRSVLYKSFLPEPGNYEFVVEVESPILVLTKPTNVAEKRRQMAEKRVAEKRQVK